MENKDLLAEYENSSHIFMQQTIDLIITNNDDYILATKGLITIKSLMEQIKDYWNEAKTQAYRTYKDISDKEKDMLAELSDTDKVLRSKICSYVNNKETAVRQIQEQTEKELGIVVAVTSDLPKVEGISYATDFDIVIENEELIPSEYKVVDTSLIKKIVKSSKGKIEIPGVKVIENKSIRVK